MISKRKRYESRYKERFTREIRIFSVYGIKGIGKVNDKIKKRLDEKLELDSKADVREENVKKRFARQIPSAKSEK